MGVVSRKTGGMWCRLRLTLLAILVASFTVSCRTVNNSSDASGAESVPPDAIASLICGSQANCLPALCADAEKCPLKRALSNKAVFDFVKTHAACEGCNTPAFSPDKGIGKCVEYAMTGDDQSWTVSFWVSDQCNFRYADPTQSRISVKVSKETLTIAGITPELAFITDPLYCKNNSDCRCLSGSGVPLIGCSNFLYAPLNWSGYYSGNDCICKAHQCIQK